MWFLFWGDLFPPCFLLVEEEQNGHWETAGSFRHEVSSATLSLGNSNLVECAAICCDDVHAYVPTTVADN